MNILKKIDEDRYFLIILFILALTVRLVVFVETGDQNADGMYRKILTINWLKDPYFIIGDIWPPLDLYLNAFMIKLFNNPMVSTRLVSLMLGTIIIFPYYYLVKLLFDKRIAMISTLLLTFVSIYIQYSALSMSEIPFVFFLITSLYFFFRFKKGDEKGEKKLANLITSAIFLNIASMLRYEAWLFIPLLAILTLSMNDIKIFSLKKESMKYLFIFLIISLIFPIFWMIGNYNLHGDFFYGQTWSDNWIKTNSILNPDWLNPPLVKKLTAWPGILFYVLNIVAIFAVLGLLISIFKKKNVIFLSFFLIIMAIFTYKFINITMTPQVRHTIMPILFLIPYFIIGVDYSLKFLNDNLRLNKNWNGIITAIIILYFVITSSYVAIANNPYVTPNYVYDASNWLKTNVKSNETVLLDEYNWWGLHILFYSGFNTTFTEDYNKNFEFVTDQVRIIPQGGKKIDEQTVINYLEKRPTYLVYSPKGKLTKILNFSSKCQNEIIFNNSFECKYTTENYNIYELKKID